MTQRKTARDIRMEQEEAEYAEMERVYREANGQVDPMTLEPLVPIKPVKEEDTLSEEEATWKKRYGDLRAYSDKIKREAAEAQKALETRIWQLERQKTELPETLEEAREWQEKYPDLARVIKTLIREDLQVAEENTSARFEELELQRFEIAKEKAFNAVLKVHPDFGDLINDEDFKDWVQRQPVERGRVGQALYDALENDIDPKAAIEAINVYKSDMKIKTAPKKQPEREAAMTVSRSVNNPPATSGGKKVYKESEIEAMSIREFERLEDDIDQARYEGRIIYDVRGAAM